MKINVIFLNTCNSTSNIYITKYILDDAKKIDNISVCYAMYSNVIEKCKKLDSPVLVCLDGQNINKEIISKARQYCRSCVLWTFEDPYTLKYNIENSHLFDLIFSNDEKSYVNYGDKGVFLPLAAPSEFCRLKPQDKKYDIFFCGTAWPNRVVILNKLLADRPNLKFKIVLSYNKHLPSLPLNLNSSAYVGRVSVDDFIGFSMRSKITLNLNRCFSSSKNDDSKPANYGPRFFEIGAVSSIQIVDNIDSTSNQYDDLLVCSSYEDLLNQIDSALENYEQTQNRAKILKKIIEKEHTYVNRVNSILEKTLNVSSKLPQNIINSSTKPCLVFVVHNVRDSEKFGGLEVHQESIANYLKQNYRVLFFTVKEYEGVRRAVLLDTNYKIVESSDPVVNLSNDNISHPLVEKFYSRILLKYDVKLVHFFHFINNCPSLCEVTHAVDIPYTISVHDFYCLCRQFNLLSYEGTYCEPSTRTNYDCDLCLKKMYGFQQNSFTVRSNYFLKMLTMAEKICFISYSSMKIFYEKFFKFDKYFLSDKIYYAPFPNNIYRYKRLNNNSKSLTYPVKYLVLGNFFSNKGAKYFLDAMLICPNIRAEFHFYGQIDESIKNTMLKLSSKAGMFFFHGPYKPGQLDLSQFHFSLHLSIWPETYCQTLSEAWAARVIPIVTDIGALGDRVKNGINGLKIDYSRPSSLVECLIKIDDGAVNFDEIASHIDDALFIEQKQHSDNYKVLFEGIINSRSKKINSDVGITDYRGFDLSSVNLKPRSLYWNKNFYNIFNKETVYPTKKDFVPIIPFSGELISSKGSIDKVSGCIFKELSSDDKLTLKNDEQLLISGWCDHPDDNDTYIPISLLVNSDRYYFVELSNYKRPDLVKFIGYENASMYGIRGCVQLLTPSQFLLGVTKVALGWLCKNKNVIYYKNDFVNVEEAFYA